MGAEENKASINTMHKGLAEEEAEALKYTLADSLAEVKAQKVSETVTDVTDVYFNSGRDASKEY